MSWSPSLRAASEPTIDASAPSARCVCPRITPGCSSNVPFTRSSNSLIRSICVRIQVSLSLSSVSDTRAPFGIQFGHRGCVRTVEDLFERQVAQVLGEDLDAPGPLVAELADDPDVPPDRDLALTRQLAPVDPLVEPLLGDPERAVAQLDPGDEPRRDP